LGLKEVEQRALHRPFDQIVRAIGAIAHRPGTALPQQCQGTLCEVDTATMQKPPNLNPKAKRPRTLIGRWGA
jgi:hypothetical protein